MAQGVIASYRAAGEYAARVMLKALPELSASDVAHAPAYLVDDESYVVALTQWDFWRNRK